MLAVFSTREIASGLYLLLLAIIVSFIPDVRKAFLKVIESALVPSLLRLALVYLFYGSIIIYRLSTLPYWKSIYMKDSILWLLFVGLPLCFGAILRNKEEGYYRTAIINNLKYTVLFECFYATFTFDLLVELIIIPVIALISMI